MPRDRVPLRSGVPSEVAPAIAVSMAFFALTVSSQLGESSPVLGSVAALSGGFLSGLVFSLAFRPWLRGWSTRDLSSRWAIVTIVMTFLSGFLVLWNFLLVASFTALVDPAPGVEGGRLLAAFDRVLSTLSLDRVGLVMACVCLSICSPFFGVGRCTSPS